MSHKILPFKACFKGSRDYLHGTDVYEALAALARLELGPDIRRLRLAIHRFFSTQPEIHWIDPMGGPSQPRDAVVDFSVEGSGTRASGWLTESGREVDCRIAYEERLIEARCKIAGDAVSVQGDTGFLPIEVAVTMTKFLHAHRLPAASGRWIFTKLDLGQLLEPADAAALAISLVDNLHGRLTKSDIRVAGKRIGSIFFSLVRR